jgi:hypothetical protein
MIVMKLLHRKLLHRKLLHRKLLHRKLLLNKLCHQVVKMLLVDVPHLQKLVLNVIVRCRVLAYVMQHVDAMQISVKNKSVK